MELWIDGNGISVEKDQSLLDLVRTLGMDRDRLSRRPLAAKLAGEVFNLNYIPVRASEADLDRPSIRRAMAASGGQVQLLYYSDPAGKSVYTRTAQFVMFLAMRRLYPEARAIMECTVGGALFVRVTGVEDFSAERLKEQVSQLVSQDIPLLRRRMSIQEARLLFEAQGREDMARLLALRRTPWFDYYHCGDFFDYFYGEMAPSTGYLQVWDILPAQDGFLFLFPDNNDPDRVLKYRELPKLMDANMQGRNWGRLMDCRTVAALNDMVENGSLRELIRVNEALHEKQYSQVADMVCDRDAHMVMLAGPSSSGKTTSANRLATQLRVHGKKPILISLDDYYRDRDTIPPGPDGKLDLEHINTIDTELFSHHVEQLLKGETVNLPRFNFLTGKQEQGDRCLTMTEDTVFIVEGLHALNPVLLPAGIDSGKVFRMYVSPLLPLNLDDHNRIPTSMLRLLRRIVRDYQTRGASVEHTLSMWDSVRRGEARWIFPFQESADVIFNSATLYELSVLKHRIFPLLEAVQPEEECYEDVRALVKVLNYIRESDPEDEIPPTSIVREFIGGNTFYRK